MRGEKNNTRLLRGGGGAGAGASVAVFLLGFGLLSGCAGSGRGAMGRSYPSSLTGRSLLRHKGAPWTILCMELRGPSRMEQMERVVQTFKKTKGIRARDVFVQDEADGVARLYYGVYYRRTDPKSGKRSMPPRLLRDLDLIKQLGNESRKYFFLFARKVRVPVPDAGDPAWALKNATGWYTLQVAVFVPTDEFWDYKRAAADYCGLLRKKGYEAYFHHTEGSSMVTVGSFGREAVIAQRKGLPRYNREVRELQQKDELLKYNRLNGAVYSAKSDKDRQVRVPSRLVRIPRKEEDSPW